MIAVQRRLLVACFLLCPSLGAPAFAQESGRMRLEGRPGLAYDARSLFAAPLPPAPANAASAQPMPHAVNAYAPEQHVRLKQMNFTGNQ